MDNQIIITLLCSLLGFSLGFVGAYFGVIKKIDRNTNKNVSQDEQIKTLFRELDDNKNLIQSVIKLHQQSLAHSTKIIDQNNILIQKIII